MINHNSNNLKGITLIETTVALGILAVGLISVVTLSSHSIYLSKASEEHIIVSNLAREGIEIVRQVRDFSKSGNSLVVFNNDNTLFFNTDDDVNTSAIDDGCYIVDSADNFNLKSQAASVDCAGSYFDISNCTNCILYQNNSTGEFSHSDDGQATQFKRVIKIISDSASEKRVLAKVVWASRGNNREFILENHLTDW